MVDSNLTPNQVKEKFSWQAFKKLDKETGTMETMKDSEVIKHYNKKYGGFFGKIVRIDKIKYVLMYFNNESDVKRAISKSTMEDDI